AGGDDVSRKLLAVVLILAGAAGRRSRSAATARCERIVHVHAQRGQIARAFGGGRNCFLERLPLPKAEPFVIDKEKRFVAAIVNLGDIHRAAHVKSELILCECRSTNARGIIEEVVRVQDFVAEEPHALPWSSLVPDF